MTLIKVSWNLQPDTTQKHLTLVITGTGSFLVDRNRPCSGILAFMPLSENASALMRNWSKNVFPFLFEVIQYGKRILVNLIDFGAIQYSFLLFFYHTLPNLSPLELEFQDEYQTQVGVPI